MAHRAALYTVRVKQKWSQDYRLLGDIDEAGTSLADIFVQYLTGFESPSEEGTKIVRCTTATQNGEELLASLQHGESGVAAEIVDGDGAHQYSQAWTDTQLLRCGGLFVLPQAETTGWLALHVNNNRGVKSLLEAGLLQRFGNQFDDLGLGITPFVHTSALREAIEQDRVANVRLIKFERPDDRAVAATSKWVRGGEWGKIEVKMSARGRAQRLATGLLRRFVGDDAEQQQAAFDEIIEFEGITFDQAKVEVVLPNDTRRTFNLEQPAAGHPITRSRKGSS